MITVALALGWASLGVLFALGFGALAHAGANDEEEVK